MLTHRDSNYFLLFSLYRIPKLSTAIILGNGPSHTLLDQIERDEFVPIFGCNFPPVKTSCSVFNDESAMKELAQRELEIPLILSERAHRQYKRDKRTQPILAVYKQRPWYSSGHQAAIKAVEMGHDHLILCGFDVIFDDTTESITDKIMVKKRKDPKDRACIREWRKRWEEVAKKDAKFEVVVPKGKVLVISSMSQYFLK